MPQPMSDALDYYAVLKVDPTADAALIKRQYYEYAKFWHPDHNEAPNALEMFQKVSVAYDILKDEKLRNWYDMLSLVYRATDFPSLGSLKIYKNQNEEDDKALRVLKQRIVTTDFKTCHVAERKDVCNFKEAAGLVFKTSLNNWLKGWWAPRAFGQNIAALKYNYAAVAAADTENLQLLIHNAVAYEQENNSEMAWIYGKQALMLAPTDSVASYVLTAFITRLDFHPQKTVILPSWQVKELRFRQWLFPLVLLMIVLNLITFAVIKGGLIDFGRQTQSYYEEREFMSGELMPYDMIDSHIMKLTSDSRSTEYLYHITRECTIYYGPDPRYDAMQQGQIGQTVRLVGYTANKAWYKIMLDNGEMGFIHKSHISKGMGNPVPEGSKVYRP